MNRLFRDSIQVIRRVLSSYTYFFLALGRIEPISNRFELKLKKNKEEQEIMERNKQSSVSDHLMREKGVILIDSVDGCRQLNIEFFQVVFSWNEKSEQRDQSVEFPVKFKQKKKEKATANEDGKGEE